MSTVLFILLIPNHQTTMEKMIQSLTKTEKSMLLFAECCVVDHGGIYQSERTNAEDREVMDRWKAEGFIDHGRVSSEFLTATRRVWITLSPEAMALAQELRRERADRMWKNRTLTTTVEKRESAILG